MAIKDFFRGRRYWRDQFKRLEQVHSVFCENHLKTLLKVNRLEEELAYYRGMHKESQNLVTIKTEEVFKGKVTAESFHYPIFIPNYIEDNETTDQKE